MENVANLKYYNLKTFAEIIKRQSEQILSFKYWKREGEIKKPYKSSSYFFIHKAINCVMVFLAGDDKS